MSNRDRKKEEHRRQNNTKAGGSKKRTTRKAKGAIHPKEPIVYADPVLPDMKITKEDVKAAAHKTRYVLTDGAKKLLVGGLLVFFAVAMMIPSLSTLVTGIKDMSDNSSNEAGLTDKEVSLVDEAGKFKRFMLVDAATGLRYSDLYDSRVTEDDAKVIRANGLPYPTAPAEANDDSSTSTSYAGTNG